MSEKIEMISERQAAKLMGIHPSTLMHWRQNGLVPCSYDEKKYVLGHTRVKYQKSKIIEWIRILNNAY